MPNWVVTDNEDMKIIAEVRDASDRAVGIVIGSLVEFHLTNFIKECFVREVKTNSKETVGTTMFHPSGPLGTFSSKIRLAYLMGLISKSWYVELENFKEIRNLFAHHLEINSFSYPKVRDKCNNFHIFKICVWNEETNSTIDPNPPFIFSVRGRFPGGMQARDKYIISAQVFCIAFTDTSIRPKREPLSPHL
jgi:DNA-binding MltR family transcriptional regulator